MASCDVAWDLLPIYDGHPIEAGRCTQAAQTEQFQLQTASDWLDPTS